MVRKIGFVGLGTVGKHMAANLARGAFDLTVYDKNADAVSDIVARGAKGAENAKQAAKGKDLVIVILPEREEWEAALASENGFLQGIDPGTLLVDMGTHSLETTTELASEAAERHVPFLEAPVWGSKEHAANGMLTVLVGGDKSLLPPCREPFSLFALNIIHVGDVGAATCMKHVIDLMQAHLVEGLAETLVFAEKLGFDVNQVLEVLDSGGVSSPLLHAKGRRFARGDFSRNLALKYVFENLETIKEVSCREKLTLPAHDAIYKVYQRAVKEGYGEEDYSAVIKVLRG